MILFSKLSVLKEKPAFPAEAIVEKAQAYIDSAQAQTGKPPLPIETRPDDAPRVQFSMRDHYSRDSISSAVKSATHSETTNWDLLSRDIGSNLNVGFVEELQELLRESGLKDAFVYKAARLDRRLFSKIMSDLSYKPAKDTCIAIALALELPLSKAEELLSRAGYTLSHSSKRDVILEFCISEKLYNIGIVNDLLYRLGEKTLGR